MNASPFTYGTTVSTDSFTNREQEAEKLRSNLMHGINTTLISPRRWGKSSLVEKVIVDIRKKEKNVKTIIIDLFSVSTEEEFLELYAREVIKASSNKWQEWMGTGKEFFKKLIPKFNVGFDEADFSLSFDVKELKKHSHEILDLPELIAKKKGIKFIICLDEFQNLSNFSDYQDFEKKMRASWQRQKNVTYCLYGSKRHMMNDIFNSPSKPFYRFGDILLLPKIETAKWVKFICKSFESSGKQIPETVAILIPQLMKNHSWYVQQLAHYTWNITSKKATATEVNAALKELIQANTPLYQKEVESISNTQLNLLKAVAKEETKFTSTTVMQHYNLGTPNNVSKNKDILINNDLIHEQNGVYEFLDPAFELWFKKQFFNQSYLK
ncbi:MAG: ATP-binding protein [Bacteroidetes bacterium]|nr:ATP-binding protein [Bacteroidota bacterium]